MFAFFFNKAAIVFCLVVRIQEPIFGKPVVMPTAGPEHALFDSAQV